MATGSVWISCQEDQIACNIGQLMMSPDYANPTELLHRLLFCLESVAWSMSGTHTILEGRTIKNYKDIVLDLDYREHIRKGKIYFIKMKDEDK